MEPLLSSHGGMVLLSGGAAVLAGFTSSLHCFAMCGPLACTSCSRPDASKAAQAATHQGARIASYAAIGGAFGLAGAHAVGALTNVGPEWLPWAVVLLLVLSALGVGEWLPRVPGATKLVQLGAKGSARLSPVARAGAFGALTPLLPCGLLMGVFLSSLMTGSLLGGALIAGGYALGNTPALVLAQLQTGWLQRLPKGASLLVRRGLPLVAAAVLAIRTLSAASPDVCVGP